MVAANAMDALNALVILPVEERKARGLEFTPKEILQQPETWHVTSARVRSSAGQITDLLDRFEALSAAMAEPDADIESVRAGLRRVLAGR